MLASRVSPKSSRYVVSRFVRLYPPVWLALIILFAVYSLLISDGTQTIQDIGKAQWLQDFLLFPVAGNALGALWSLTWEVLFSVTLFIWIRVVRKGNAFAQMAALTALVSIGDLLNSGLLEYLPMFLIGVSMWANRDSLEALFNKLRASIFPQIIFLSMVVTLTLPYTLAPIFQGEEGVFEVLRNWLYFTEFAGLATLMGYALWSPLAGQVLKSWPLAWLGRISYSLYLVHQIVIIWVDNLNLAAGFTFMFDIVLSLVAAFLFYQVFEKRVHQLARRIAATNA